MEQLGLITGTCNNGKVLQLYRLVRIAEHCHRATQAATAMLWAHKLHKCMSMLHKCYLASASTRDTYKLVLR